MKNKARILVLDCETAPLEAYAWGLRDQNLGIEQIKHDQYMLMWAAKWVGEEEVHSDALINHPSCFRDNKRDDRQIALSLRKVMDEANIIVTQNGEHFDLKWANTLFLKHNIEKPSKFYSVDLLKESRNQYYSVSHKLDFRGRQLALGQKMPHEGFRLWLECMGGNKSAWECMIAYCCQDVRLTERYYLKLRPRMKNHPNVNMFKQPTLFGQMKCGACSGNNLVMTGYNYYATGKKKRYRCKNCGYRMQGGKALRVSKLLLKGDG